MSGEDWGVSLTIQQKLRETTAESLTGQVLLQEAVTAALFSMGVCLTRGFCSSA